jgi:predicted nucleic acid-binding protein
VALAGVPLVHEDVPEATASRRILHLAEQFDLSSYAAAYLELADRFKIPLHSADAKLIKAADRLGLAP